MKKRLRPILLAGLIGILGYLGWGILVKIQARHETAGRIARLPPFRFKTLSGETITQQHTGEKPLWLIFFHADCEYCQMEAKTIQQQSAHLKHLSIWLVSPEHTDTLKAFSRRYGLDTLPNVQLLHAQNHDHLRTFGVHATPSSLLYRPDGSLIKQVTGIVSPKAVAKLTL